MSGRLFFLLLPFPPTFVYATLAIIDAGPVKVYLYYVRDVGPHRTAAVGHQVDPALAGN